MTILWVTTILNHELLWQVFPFLLYKALCGCYRDEPLVRILQAEIWGRRIQIAAEMFSFVLIFMACCTAIHMFLCISNIITSFQKDRQHNEWMVKHAHKNSSVCLEVCVICFWFTVHPVLHFHIISKFSIKNKHLMVMQLILIFIFPPQGDKKVCVCVCGGHLIVMAEHWYYSHRVHYRVINACEVSCKYYVVIALNKYTLQLERSAPPLP